VGRVIIFYGEGGIIWLEADLQVAFGVIMIMANLGVGVPRQRKGVVDTVMAQGR